jgi:DNA (cytosine-5)-methyltransferase 1
MYKVLDLFSGIGGFSLGFERTGGFETVAFCEIEKYPRAILAQHWPQVRIYNDVKTLTAQQMAADGIVPDVICGGFPCQDISLAGKGAGLEGERSGLWWEFHRLIKEIRPRWVIAENVSALRSRGLDTVLGSLAEIGYDAEWHCIPASAVGAPHRRDRIWIVAYPHSDGQRSGFGSEQPARHTAGERIGDGGGLDRSRMVADTTSPRLSQWGRPQWEESAEEAGTGMVSELERPSEALADPSIPRLQRNEWCWPAGEEGEPAGHIAQCGWWAVEPDVGRVAHGIPKRVDRLKALGNAVVPQIPELIGYAILNEMENENGTSKTRR